MHIELRSDTFTKPTPGMLEAMMAASIGDDVFGEDASTKELESTAAEIFGFESAVFCVSGTMANQMALNVYLKPGDEVICDALSHIHLYEGGGVASNSMASVNLLQGDRGRLTADQIAEAIKPDNVHYPVSRGVSLENTVNKGGGSIYDIHELRKISTFCKEKNLFLHLDGARLCNALATENQSPKTFGEIIDSISVCLSKGLGAPMGSVLLGSKPFIANARRVRKRWGGGWRQSGYMAAAGLYALTQNMERLKEDHQRASQLAQILKNRPEVLNVLPVDSNIILFELDIERITVDDYIKKLESQQIFASAFGKNQLRMVTHLDFRDDHLHEISPRLSNLDL